MTRDDLLRELRECAFLADREIARQKAREAIQDYYDIGTFRAIVWPNSLDDEITAAYKAAICMEED